MNNDLILILNAANFAADRHRRQRRKDAHASPYINHPLALADILAREGGVEEAVVIAAALLHDTIEDTETTLKELTAGFGKRVAASHHLEAAFDEAYERGLAKLAA
jgi:guanosine-3',5'-bis(diphosphate) 3'-pyrophosphohydrolase